MARRPPSLSSLLDLLAREWLVVTALAVYAVVVLVALPQELVQDAWLTLVGGREVAHHGLPSTDRLAVWTSGTEWIDQQWLAQLGFYGLYLLGGIRLALLGHAALLVTALACAVVAARRRGATPKSVFLVAALCMLMAPWALQLRAQSVAELLFVWLLWALVEDSRSPSRRVLVAIPLLALWANVHGTVVMGVALCVLRGATILAARGEPHRRLRAAALLAFAPATLVASPYGLDLVGYYRRLLLNPMLHWFIDEWGPSSPSQKTAIFFVVGAATIWVVARHGSRLTPFERLALLFALASALVAIRSIVWFALTALVVLPYALDGALRPSARARAAPALVALGAAVAAVVFVATRPPGWYTREWPRPAARAVAQAAERDPQLLVMSDDRYADWLLWEEPRLAGRVAYDVRFELLSDEQFRRLFAYRNRIGDDWRSAGRGYGLVALDGREQKDVLAALLRERDARVVYRDPSIHVVLRPVPARALASVR